MESKRRRGFRRSAAAAAAAAGLSCGWLVLQLRACARGMRCGTCAQATMRW
jgi:hypothetical protein